jgi:hypothetical protein
LDKGPHTALLRAYAIGSNSSQHLLLGSQRSALAKPSGEDALKPPQMYKRESNEAAAPELIASVIDGKVSHLSVSVLKLSTEFK